MKIDSFITLQRPALDESQREALQKEKTAIQVEELFARHLVEEMTKNAFKMTEDSAGIGSQSSMYREFVTDALASQLAAQKQLGMADLMVKHWDRTGTGPGSETVPGISAGSGAGSNIGSVNADSLIGNGPNAGITPGSGNSFNLLPDAAPRFIPGNE
jgi:Rod binding domain-containing protein